MIHIYCTCWFKVYGVGGGRGGGSGDGAYE